MVAKIVSYSCTHWSHTMLLRYWEYILCLILLIDFSYLVKMTYVSNAVANIAFTSALHWRQSWILYKLKHLTVVVKGEEQTAFSINHLNQEEVDISVSEMLFTMENILEQTLWAYACVSRAKCLCLLPLDANFYRFNLYKEFLKNLIHLFIPIKFG